MQDPAEVVQPRAAPLKIFFPPNNDLRSPNTLLHRSAVVLLGPGARLSQMPYRIANSLATSLGRHPKEFTVSETDPSFGDYLVTFTSNMLRIMACYVGAFMVAPGVQVQLREWTTSLAMVRDPTTYKARIKLHGLPFAYWNFPDVNHLISGFGYAERMSRVVTNRNFKCLQVLVACYDVADIPPSLWLTKNPHSRIVHVELEGWVHNSNLPFYPPNEGDGNDTSSDDSSDDTADGNRHHQVGSNSNTTVRRTNQQVPNRGQGRQAGCADCMGQDRRCRAITDANTEVQEMQLDTPVQTVTGGTGVSNYVQRPGKEIAHGPREISQPSRETALVNRDQQIGTKWPLHLTQYEVLSIMSRLLPAGKQKGSLSLLFQDKHSEIGDSGEQLAANFQNLSCQVEAHQGVNGLILEEMEPGLIPQQISPQSPMPQQAEHMTTGLSQLTEDSPTGYKDQEGSPPGFAGPPKYKNEVQAGLNIERPDPEFEKGKEDAAGLNIERSDPESGKKNEEGVEGSKHSARLQAKNTGRYISVVDKARANQGFIGVTEIMQRPKPKIKQTKPQKPALEYLQNFAPLTKEHAEAVVAAAGVIVTPALEVQMEEAMTRSVGVFPQPCIN